VLQHAAIKYIIIIQIKLCNYVCEFTELMAPFGRNLEGRERYLVEALIQINVLLVFGGIGGIKMLYSVLELIESDDAAINSLGTRSHGSDNDKEVVHV